MTEPDVALTDFALALESAVFAVTIWRSWQRVSGIAGWLILYFATAAVSSLCGGLVHGFFLDDNALGHDLLWSATLLAIGVNAVTAWAIGARLLFSPSVARWVAVVAGLGFAAYAGSVILGVQAFRVAAGMAVPATLFLLCALLLVYRRERCVGALIAAIGLLLTLAAILVQQLGIGLDPMYFNHNAVAHIVQAVALALFVIGGLRLVDPTTADSRRRATCLRDASS